jgi:hypothetical protein
MSTLRIGVDVQFKIEYDARENRSRRKLMPAKKKAAKKKKH